MKIGNLLFVALGLALPIVGNAAQNCPDLLNFEVQKLNSSERVRLCDAFAGQVVLVVNTASKCGFTPQFEELEALYREKKDQGFTVLGFPSNDFRQELNKDEAISDFCRINYGVTFPMFSQVSVRGEQAHPFYKALSEAADSKPRWNFYKYVIDRDGKLVDSFSSFTAPDSQRLRKTIEAVL